MAASAPTMIPPMSRKIAGGWPSRWASRRIIFSACTRSIRPTPWWRPGRGPAHQPRADAIVTRTEGLAIGVTAADCGPILFVDPNARVIGAAHAGWKGALTGIVESTVDAMEKLGADRGGMVAAIGPLIRQHSYEVGGEFVERFLDAAADNALFFIPAERAGPFDVRPRRLHPDAAGKRRRPDDRRHRRRHLFRRALLQLPPLGASQGAGLRPARSRDRAGTRRSSGSNRRSVSETRIQRRIRIAWDLLFPIRFQTMLQAATEAERCTTRTTSSMLSRFPCSS